MKKIQTLVIGSISFLGLLLASCSNDASKKAFEKKIDEIDYGYYANVNYISSQKITYLENAFEEVKEYNAYYDSLYDGYLYPDDEYNEESRAYLYIPNLTRDSVDSIFENYSPRINKEDYKASYQYSQDPLSFTIKIKGNKNPKGDYKDYSGNLYCEFNQYGWLVKMNGYYKRYMTKTQSILIEELNVLATYTN